MSMIPLPKSDSVSSGGNYQTPLVGSMTPDWNTSPDNQPDQSIEYSKSVDFNLDIDGGERGSGRTDEFSEWKKDLPELPESAPIDPSIEAPDRQTADSMRQIKSNSPAMRHYYQSGLAGRNRTGGR